MNEHKFSTYGLGASCVVDICEHCGMFRFYSLLKMGYMYFSKYPNSWETQIKYKECGEYLMEKALK